MCLKVCTGCQQEKPLDQFAKDKRAPQGRGTRCRECARAKLVAWRDANPGHCGGCGKVLRGRDSRWCHSCKNRGARNPRYVGRQIVVRDGYRIFTGYPEHPNADRWGKVAEHTVIMAEHIGRPLLKGETVHHKNGQRDDNRISNLELWSTSQPAGQRVEDKLEWAVEFIKIYHPEWLYA